MVVGAASSRDFREGQIHPHLHLCLCGGPDGDGAQREKQEWSASSITFTHGKPCGFGPNGENTLLSLLSYFI